jgi:putative ABC transport system substrate-binding protein
MRRREFIAVVGGAVVAMPVAVSAQRSGIVVVGALSPEWPKTGNVDGLIEGLRGLGYVEGRNIRFEYRWAEGKFDHLSELAADLIHLKVDVIVAFVTKAAEVAKNQTSTIPIVMVGVADPVGAGLATSLARPGGNVTMAVALVAKQLELLKLVAPPYTTIAAFFNPTNITFQTLQVKEAKKASEALGLQLRFLEVREPSEFEAAFDTVSQERIGVLLILADPLFFANSKQLGAREVSKLGHTVRLMPPSYVKGYVKRSKNDAADAAAICEAVTRPSMRFVPIKSADQQVRRTVSSCVSFVPCFRRNARDTDIGLPSAVS